jgi:glycogen(starch) synthase
MPYSQTSEIQLSNGTILQLGMGWFTEEPGGLNRMYAGLYGALQAQHVPLCGLVAGSSDVAGPLPQGVEFFAPRDAGLLSRLAAARRHARRLLPGVDLVAAHFAPYVLPVLDLLGTRRFVFHFHGPWARESQAERESGSAVFAKRFIESRVYRRADRCIVLSRAFAETLSQEYGVDRERIHVVPGGVDAARFAAIPARETCRSQLGLPAGRQIVGTVRRLVHRVGVDLLIEALSGIRDRAPDALLVVAGRGPLAAVLEEQVTRLGLQGQVRFLGFVGDDQLPLFYGACDFTVVPSVALEGFGLTTIESLAAGTPVLVTPVGGLPETVETLDPGLVLREASVPALGEGLLRALQDPSVLPSREACFAHVRRQFDWPVIARLTQDVYRG